MNREEAKINCNLNFCEYLLRNGFLNESEAPQLSTLSINESDIWTTDIEPTHRDPDLKTFAQLCSDLKKCPIYKFSNFTKLIQVHVDKKTLLTISLASKCEVRSEKIIVFLFNKILKRFELMVLMA